MPHNYTPVGSNFWTPLDIEKRNQLRASCDDRGRSTIPYWVAIYAPGNMFGERFTAIAHFYASEDQPDEDYFQFLGQNTAVPVEKVTHVAPCPFPKPPPLE